MGWSIGFDDNWDRDIGYGVPCVCDEPNCNERIHRGLSYVCGTDPYGGAYGCGLYFCGKHLNSKEVKNKRTIQAPGEEKISVQLCDRCYQRKQPFEPKPDIAEWINHKLTHHSWQQWRDENTEEVEKLRKNLAHEQN